MRKQMLTFMTVGALLAFLPACVEKLPKAGAILAEPANAAPPIRSFAPACPSPTPAAKRSHIARELEAALSGGSAPDVLAAEWERLDDGARACRGAR